MKKINKITTIALVFTLVGIVFKAHTGYPSTALRTPLLGNSQEGRERLRKATPGQQNQRKGKFAQGTVEGLLESTVNPYWTGIKKRLEVLRPYIDEEDKDIISELQEPYDIHDNWKTLTFIDKDAAPYEAKTFRVRVRNNIILGPAKGGIRYCTGTELMNERTGILAKTLDRLSELKATREQVEIFLAKWLREETQALSLRMTLKNSVAGLSLGGGKGVVFIGYVAKENGKWVLKNYDNWKDVFNLAKIARSHSRDLAKAGKIGVDIDVPAPDINTNKHVLSWYEDEYLKYLVEETSQIQDADPELYKILKKAPIKNVHEIIFTPLLDAANKYSKQNNPVPWLGAFTGKPVDLGGSLGRLEATGFGGMDVMRALIDVKGKTISVQGVGNVGVHVALDLAREGAVIQYLSDHTMALYKEEGFSVEELEAMAQWVNTRLREETLVDYYMGGKIKGQPKGKFGQTDWGIGLDERTKEVLGAKVDILVLAALENQIRHDNVNIIKAKVIVELANGPVTIEAERVLDKKGVLIIPDILANSGGVIVSSLETDQAVSGKWYTFEEVSKRRRNTLEKATHLIKDVMEQHKISSYRIAGDINAVLRIVRAKQIDVLWENALLNTAKKLHLSSDKLIERLRKGNMGTYDEVKHNLSVGLYDNFQYNLSMKAHNDFRHNLSMVVVKDLTEAFDGIENVWLSGSTEYNTAGAFSDIDLILEVTSEEEKRKVYDYFEFLNSHIAGKFNKIMEVWKIVEISGLFDVAAKIFTHEEIESRQSFAVAIESLWTPVSLLYTKERPQSIPATKHIQLRTSL